MFHLTSNALLVIGEVSKVVMEYVLSAMSGNLVLREDLCEGMKGGIICMCHQLQLSYWERSQLRRVWRSYLHVQSGLPGIISS